MQNIHYEIPVIEYSKRLVHVSMPVCHFSILISCSLVGYHKIYATEDIIKLDHRALFLSEMSLKLKLYNIITE